MRESYIEGVAIAYSQRSARTACDPGSSKSDRAGAMRRYSAREELTGGPRVYGDWNLHGLNAVRRRDVVSFAP